MRKKYQSPQTKVVEFRVELGSIISNGSQSTQTELTFGGNYELGGDEHSGLGSYDDGGDFFSGSSFYND